MLVIDCHSTFYPKEFIKELARRKQDPRLIENESGRRIIVEGSVFYSHVIEPQHSSPEARIKDLDKYGIDIQILSPSAPGYDRFEPEVGIKLSKVHNDEVSTICERYPDRFLASAALPLQDVDAAIDELKRAIEDLGLHGVCFYSNNAGKLMDDPVFYPLYERIEKYGIPIFLHPNAPLTIDLMQRVKIPPPILGFTFDTTMTLVSLAYSGVLEKFNLKIISPHTGGTVPFLMHRFDSSYNAFKSITGWELKNRPSELLKNLYYDTCSFYPPALMCTYEAVGGDHLLMGTDYPHLIGGIDRSVQIIESLSIPESDKEGILGLNAARIYKLRL
jgi:aminocarboxymuconate-semialdehyde decarboxylase